LIHAIGRYLRENIDDNIKIRKWDVEKKLPPFLLVEYDFYETKIMGQHCMLLEILQEAPGIETLKKHLKVINKTVDAQIVFVYKSISRFRRKSLIENRIPFVVEDGQMYLPFLGLDLKNMKENQVKKVTTFSSSTQLAFLYLLYNEMIYISAVELATALNTSMMTASRILNDLYDTGLLTFEIGGKTGRSKMYKKIDAPLFYGKGSKYLRNPVMQTVYTSQKMMEAPIAGLEALSLISMMNPPKNSAVAIDKEGFKKNEHYIIKDKDRIADEKLTEVEVWRYNPKLLSNQGKVDIVSLALSLKELNDERVEQALEEKLKGESWYTG